LLVWRHRANIARLFAGTESRLGTPRAPSHGAGPIHGHGHGKHAPQARRSHR
jgi:hypothetical protein